jgi:hypothetical protein
MLACGGRHKISFTLRKWWSVEELLHSYLVSKAAATSSLKRATPAISAVRLLAAKYESPPSGAEVVASIRD